MQIKEAGIIKIFNMLLYLSDDGAKKLKYVRKSVDTLDLEPKKKNKNKQTNKQTKKRDFPVKIQNIKINFASETTVPGLVSCYTCTSSI